MAWHLRIRECLVTKQKMWKYAKRMTIDRSECVNSNEFRKLRLDFMILLIYIIYTIILFTFPMMHFSDVPIFRHSYLSVTLNTKLL